MTLSAFPGFLIVPEPRTVSTVAPTVFRTIKLDASGEQGAVILKVPKTGTISKVGFRTGTITQMTNSFKVGIQNVDATTGFPDGTAYGSMVAGTGTPSANTFTWYSLSTGASATVEDDIAIVIEFDSFAASDDIDLNIGVQRESSAINTSYVASKLGGTWSDELYPPNIAIEYDDGSIECLPDITPYSDVAEDIWSSSSNPDRRGIRFKFPGPVSINGMWAYLRRDQDVDFIIYDSDGSTELRRVSFDKDLRGSSTNGNVKVRFAPLDLTADTYYYAVILPTTTSSIRAYYFDVVDDGANTTMDAEPMGDLFHAATVNGAPTGTGDWTTTLTRRYHMGVSIYRIDDGGGGGVAGGGNMRGGFSN